MNTPVIIAFNSKNFGQMIALHSCLIKGFDLESFPIQREDGELILAVVVPKEETADLLINTVRLNPKEFGDITISK